MDLTIDLKDKGPDQATLSGSATEIWDLLTRAAFFQISEKADPAEYRELIHQMQHVYAQWFREQTERLRERYPDCY